MWGYVFLPSVWTRYLLCRSLCFLIRKMGNSTPISAHSGLELIFCSFLWSPLFRSSASLWLYNKWLKINPPIFPTFLTWLIVSTFLHSISLMPDRGSPVVTSSAPLQKTETSHMSLNIKAVGFAVVFRTESHQLVMSPGSAHVFQITQSHSVHFLPALFL